MYDVPIEFKWYTKYFEELKRDVAEFWEEICGRQI